MNFKTLLSGVIGIYVHQGGMTLEEVASCLETFACELRNPSLQRAYMRTVKGAESIADSEFRAHLASRKLHLVPPEPLEVEAQLSPPLEEP